MPTNLAIDDKLIEEARRLGKQKTKRAVVTQALEEYIQRHQQVGILEMFHQVDMDPDYDYKEQRKKS
jgi:Arc/MetJ family transcription regulator